MDITVDSHELAEALAVVGRAVAVRDTLPALTGILLQVSDDTLVLTASDLNLSLRVAIPVTVIEDGEALLPGKSLGELSRRLPRGMVHLRVYEGGAELSFTGGQFRLPLLERDRFPDPVFPVQEDFRLLGADLRRLIERVSFASAKGEVHRPILSGVEIQLDPGGLTAVASDSVRLAWAVSGTPGSEGPRVVIPASALDELGRLLTEDEVGITIEERYAYWRQGRWMAGLRFLEGSYPDFNRLLPEAYPYRFVLAASELAGSLERLHLVAESRHPQARLSFRGATLSLHTSSEAGLGQEEIGVVPEEGEDIEVVFNSRYLLEILRNMGATELRLALAGPEAPAKLEVPGQEGQHFVILLPIRYR